MTQLPGLMIGLLALLIVGSAGAQTTYPTKPIRLIVPFPPGGGADILARILLPRLTETFKQPIVVDNRPGGGSTLGAETAVRASPDGYTLLLTSSSYATNAALYVLPYDPMNDVAPIALLGENGAVVTLHPSVPVTSIKELIRYDKVNPGRLNYGSSGTGGFTHLVTELFNQMAGTRMIHVPYKGNSSILNDLLGGQIQLAIGPLSVMTSHVKSNRLRGIAVTTAKRFNTLPDIPAVAETVPGYETANWHALLGPKALPKGIVARWSNEINRILQLPDVKESMARNGSEHMGGSPERFGEVLKRDIAKWQKVVKTADIKLGS